MKGSVCFVFKFALLPFLPISPLKCKFQNKTGTEPLIQEYPAPEYFLVFHFYDTILDFGVLAQPPNSKGFCVAYYRFRICLVLRIRPSPLEGVQRRLVGGLRLVVDRRLRRTALLLRVTPGEADAGRVTRGQPQPPLGQLLLLRRGRRRRRGVLRRRRQRRRHHRAVVHAAIQSPLPLAMLQSPLKQRSSALGELRRGNGRARMP